MTDKGRFHSLGIGTEEERWSKYNATRISDPKPYIGQVVMVCWGEFRFVCLFCLILYYTWWPSHKGKNESWIKKETKFLCPGSSHLTDFPFHTGYQLLPPPWDAQDQRNWVPSDIFHWLVHWNIQGRLCGQIQAKKSKSQDYFWEHQQSKALPFGLVTLQGCMWGWKGAGGVGGRRGVQLVTLSLTWKILLRVKPM